MKRELEEELSIQAETGKFICSNKYHYDHLSIELLAYRTKYISGTFTLVDHDEIKWVSPAELLDYDLAEADVPIARKLNRSRV